MCKLILRQGDPSRRIDVVFLLMHEAHWLWATREAVWRHGHRSSTARDAKSSQPITEIDEDGVSVRRCRGCGFPSAPASSGQPRPAVDLAVPMRSATLTFRTEDGKSFEGTLSLHLNAEKHQGTETVLDRLNDLNLFLPLRVPGDLHVVFLNKIHIVRVDVPHEEGAPVDPEDVAETNIQSIKVQLINGELPFRVR